MHICAFANAVRFKVPGLANAREDASERESQKGTEQGSSVVSVFGLILALGLGGVLIVLVLVARWGLLLAGIAEIDVP